VTVADDDDGTVDAEEFHQHTRTGDPAQVHEQQDSHDDQREQNTGPESDGLHGSDDLSGGLQQPVVERR
jgi:hypothetical protein